MAYLLSQGLRQPLTFKLHYGARESALDLSHAFAVFNGSLPDGANLAPLGATPPTKANSGFGSLVSRPATLDIKNHALIVQYTLSTPSSSMTWNTNAPVAVFGKPDPFNVDLSAGALNSSLPLDVPSGPGGLTPPINLTYSSAGVSEQHNPQGAAGWAGAGWNLDLGAISWAEHNSNSSCTSGCGNGWEDTWQLSDPFGTSVELIPPNINVSTFFDDTPNNYCGADGNANNATSYPCPILWHSTPENYAKVYAYIGSLTLPDGANAHPPCFRVWLNNGIMEEFGCTSDSIEYYYAPGMGDYISSWKLDLITDPQGNQIHITYHQDVSQKNVSGVNHQYIRDSVLNTVEWDSPSCHNAQSMCTGSSWAPLVRVNFASTNVPQRLTNSPSGCNTGANLRCDDPLDLSGSSGLAAPDVQATLVLNDAIVQARTTGTGGWNTLKDYQFSYQMSGPSQITDPSTGKAESAAGSLLMTQLAQAGVDSTTALMYSGMDNSATSSYAYLKTLDVSANNIVVSSNTYLSYWIFPQSSITAGSVSGNNSSCVAIDMIFSDGSDLRDSGAVDQNGNRVHPAYQCGHLKLDQWNLVTSNIGAHVSGKTINHIDVGYDQPSNTGGYRGYVDDISLTNGNTTLFSTGFESGQQQPNWTNTVDSGSGSEGGLSNVGGYCCSLTGPELGARTETAHPTTTQSVRTFSYGSVTEYYEDDVYHPNGTAGCGPSWNTGNGSGCLLWSQSYASNSWYMTSASNGLGLQQTFIWANARDNAHGVTGGGSNNADPLYCNSHQSGYPCNEADDQNWSHAVITQQEGDVVRAASTGPTTVKSILQYAYSLTYPLPAQECPDCVAGMYWGNQNNGDYLDYYDAKYMGFAETDVTNQDGSVTKHHFDATEGYGLYDASVPCLAYIKPCRVAPWWDTTNAAHGHETETDFFDTNGATLLKKVTNQYQAVCPPSGVSGTPSWSTTLNGSPYTYTWDGKLVAELDHGNPVVVCDVQNSRTDEYTYDGSGSNIDKTTTYSYDSLGRRTQTTETSSDGSTTSNPTTIVTHTDYIQNNAVSATSTSATGIYMIDIPADTIVEDSANTSHFSCTYTGYDGHAWATGQQSGLTLGEATNIDQYTSCGTASNSGLVRKTYAYDASGNQLTSTDPMPTLATPATSAVPVAVPQPIVCAPPSTTYSRPCRPALPMRSTKVYRAAMRPIRLRQATDSASGRCPAPMPMARLPTTPTTRWAE